jgi:hypothetical protein
MALTLVEAGKLHASNGEYRKAGITMAFASSHPIVGAMPVVNIQGNSYAWNEEGVLPSVAARAVGETYTASEGKFTLRTEALKVYGGTVNVDRVIVQTMGEERRSQHVALKAKALGQALGYDLIEGSTTTSASNKVIDGLKSRFLVDNSQTLDEAGSACQMSKLDQVYDMVANPTHWLMTRELARGIATYLRGSGTAVQMSRDEFGRPLMSYRDLPILIADPVDVASGYQGLADAAGDDGANETSVFCMNLSTEGLHLVQNGGMAIEDLGLADGGTQYNTLVEWIIGLVDEGPHCVARYAGVLGASSVTA